MSRIVSVKYFLITFVFLFLFLPNFSEAANLRDVVINEVAWAGNKKSSADEWIELKSNINNSIDIAGWGIYEQAGDVLIVYLNGVLQPHSFYLIERTDDDTVFDFSASREPAPFKGSGLSNTGEHLVLKDSEGNIIDSVNASGGWFAGNASPDYSSMERIDSNISGDDPLNWQSNDGVARNGHDVEGNPINGTPLAENSKQSENVGGSTPYINEEESQKQESEEADNYKGVDEVGLSSPPEKGEREGVLVQANAGDDIFTFLGETVQFDALRSLGDNLSFSWNLGNGEIINEKQFGYVYQFPGKYIVTLTVSDNINKSTDDMIVEVISGGIKISEFLANPEGNDTDTEWIEIYNSGDYLVDLGGWQLDDIADGGSKPWIFPDSTFLSPDGYIVISREVSGIALNNNSDSARLIYPNGLVADEIVYEKTKEGISGIFMGGSFFWSKYPTPGMPNILEAEVTKSLGAKPINSYFVESFDEAYKEVIYNNNNNSKKEKKNLMIISSNDNMPGIVEELSTNKNGNNNQLTKLAPSKKMLQASVGTIFSFQDVTLIIIISLFSGAGVLYSFFQIKQKRRALAQIQSCSQQQEYSQEQEKEQGAKQGANMQEKRSWEIFVN